jgi:hypothetical protein
MVELPKGDWDKRGTWHPSIARPKQGPPIVSALLCCPKCAIDGDLGNHAIAPDGTVTPSCVCRDCGWHDNVKLIGWDPSAP